ncbi:MAG: conjugative transposon protein TraN, partial [Bacteroidales bacterium]|nr:conjugative transposon protein TraN [Bacteroidales bacterium]
FPLFTIPRDKVLRVDLHELNGGRHQIFDIETPDLTHAKDLQEFARFVID